MCTCYVDAAKHISPDDLVAILTKLKSNMGMSYEHTTICSVYKM